MWRTSARYQTRLRHGCDFRLTFENLESRQMLAADIGLTGWCGTPSAMASQIQIVADPDSVPEQDSISPNSISQLSQKLGSTELNNDSLMLIEFQESPDRHSGSQIWRQYTIEGVVEKGVGIQLPSAIIHAVFNEKTETIFAISDHELYELNPATGQMVLHRFNGDFTNPSWLSGITFDSTHNRILIASTGGGGFGSLYEFDLDEGQWGKIVDFDRSSDVLAVTYDADTNTIWTLQNSGIAVLVALDQEGNTLRTVEFGDQIPFESITRFYASQQLTFHDGNLVFVSVLHENLDPAFASQPEEIIYLLEPDTATATETSRTVLPGERPNDNVSTHIAGRLPGFTPEVNESLDLETLFEGVDEVHMVSLYENSSSERATIVIDRPGKTVGLILTAYDRARWDIVATEGTVLKSVLLGGYHGQSITGLSDNVQVVDATYTNSELPDREYIDSPIAIDSFEFRNAIARIFAFTGAQVSSFTGSYGYTGEIEINMVSDDPRLNPGYPGVVDPDELPDFEFQGVEFVDEIDANGEYERNVFLVFYSLLGSDAEKVRIELPRIYIDATVNGEVATYDYPIGTDFVLVPDTNTLIASNRAHIYQIDLLTLEYSELELPADYSTRNSHIQAVTYDSIRDRLVVAIKSSDWTEGVSLMEYSFASQEWGTIANFDFTVQIEALAFDAESDLIWALVNNEFGMNGPRDLIAIDNQGVIVDSIDFDDQVLPDLMIYGTAFNNPQLFVEDGKVIYLSSAVEPLHTEMGYQESFMYLIDPADDSMQLTWRSTTLP